MSTVPPKKTEKDIFEELILHEFKRVDAILRKQEREKERIEREKELFEQDRLQEVREELEERRRQEQNRQHEEKENQPEQSSEEKIGQLHEEKKEDQQEEKKEHQEQLEEKKHGEQEEPQTNQTHQEHLEESHEILQEKQEQSTNNEQPIETQGGAQKQETSNQETTPPDLKRETALKFGSGIDLQTLVPQKTPENQHTPATIETNVDSEAPKQDSHQNIPTEIQAEKQKNNQLQEQQQNDDTQPRTPELQDVPLARPKEQSVEVNLTDEKSLQNQEKEEEEEEEEKIEESALDTLLQKKFTFFLMRKLRVGNKEALRIMSFPPVLHRLIEYLNDNDHTPNIHGSSKEEESQESAQLILSTGRKEIAIPLLDPHTDLLSLSFQTIRDLSASSRPLSPGFSFHFSKVIISLLEFNYSEMAEFLNRKKEYLSYLIEYIESPGITDILIEMLALNLKNQLFPKLKWLSESLVSSLTQKLLSQLQTSIDLKKMPPTSSSEDDSQHQSSPITSEIQQPSFDATLTILLHLLDTNPDLSYPLFAFENLSLLLRKIIEADVVHEFFTFIQKLLDMNISWIKRPLNTNNPGAQQRGRFMTSTSFSNFGNWSNLSSGLPLSPFQQSSTSPQGSPSSPPLGSGSSLLTASSDQLSTLYSSASFVGESSIPICIFENGELIPIVLKILMLCLPRLRNRLFRYHAMTHGSPNSKTEQSLKTLSAKEEDLHLSLKKQLHLQRDQFQKNKNKQNNENKDQTQAPSSPQTSPIKKSPLSQDCNDAESTEPSETQKKMIDPHSTVLDSDRELEEQERLKQEAQQEAEAEEQIIMVVVPLGLQRWAIIRLVLHLLSTGYHSIDSGLVESRILAICIRLFLSHNCSNMLHCIIVEMLYRIFERNHLKIIQFLIERLNLPGMLMEAYQTLPPPSRTDFISFREHLLIVIGLVAKENRFAQNLLAGNERWKQFIHSLQPKLDSLDIDNFYKKNSHRFLM